MQPLKLDIPESCGALLLTGTALFPNSSMDLHIFEPRYKSMLEQSLESHWMIAIANLIAPEEEPFSSCVSPIGTLGLINTSKTLPDGRSALILTGLHPIRFENWNEESTFPTADITVLEREVMEEKQSQSIRDLLLDTLPAHLTHLPDTVQSSVLSNLKAIPEVSALIDNVSHNFISDTHFRHELLSELDDKKRASKLISALSS